MPDCEVSIGRIIDDSLEAWPFISTRIGSKTWSRPPKEHIAHSDWHTSTWLAAPLEARWCGGISWQECNPPSITIQCKDTSDIDIFIFSIRHFQEINKIDYAIGLIYEKINSLLKNNALKECDALLEMIRPTSISPQLGITILMATTPVKSKLTNRKMLSSLYRTAMMAEQSADEVEYIFKYVE